MDLKSLHTTLKEFFHPHPITARVNGREYAVTPLEDGAKLGDLILPPVAAKLSVKSLTGFVDAFMADVDEFRADRFAVQVLDHETVSLISLQADEYGRRHEWLRAVSEEKNPFPFDSYQSSENFLINLQRGFMPTDNIVELQKLASALTNESSISTQDDGLSQTLSVKQGAVTRATVNLPPRIKLFPYRTFREIDPVESEFMVRLKGEPMKMPTIALVEVDCSRWKMDTALMVKNWLVKQLPSGTVVIA
jgi:hypothetical protein